MNELKQMPSSVDYIHDMQEGYLHTLIMVTWSVPIIGILTLTTAAPRFGDFSTIHNWAFTPFVVIAAFNWLANYLLHNKEKYIWAVYVYLSGFIVAMLLFMLGGDTSVGGVAFRDSGPFILTLIASTAGLFLPPASALIFTASAFALTLPVAVIAQVNAYTLVLALVLAAASTGIANLTAGSLYKTATLSAESYIQMRRRVDEFWQNKEELSKALEERKWLYQELETTNRALETSNKVGQQITSILKIDILLSEVVDLIQENFGYYFVGVWRPHEQEEILVLQSGVRRAYERLERQVLEGLHIPVTSPSVVVSVFKSGDDRTVNDVYNVPDYFPIDELPHTRSAMALPLQIGKRTIGVLDIQSQTIAAFNEDDRSVMQALANQIAVAIRNAELYTVEQSRRQLAESLVQTGRVLSSSLDLREVPARILEELADVVPYARGSVMIQEGATLRSIAQRGFPLSHQSEGVTVFLRKGDVFEKIAATHAPLIIKDTLGDPRFQQLNDLEQHLSWMGVPLIAKDRVIGMISLTRREANAFTSEDAQLVLAFAGQAAIALENAHLYEEIREFNEELELRVQARTEELNQAYQTLEKMDQNKSDFIRVVAHELRTPLTVIKGYSQMLKNLASSDTTDPFLHGIVNGTERMHGIVNSMLDVAMIDNQALNMTKRRVEIKDEYEPVCSSFMAALRERQITLTSEGIYDLPKIKADGGLIQKVLRNVIGNAIKYTPDGGRIHVAGQVIEVDGETPIVEITVEDTGIGIDPEYQELIFEKFYQMGEVAVHSSGRTKFKGGGPGLGLAIARGIIQAHGGRIWVESAGHDEATCPGSKFYIWLPIE
ncbi:MAG: GAF domain-containing protein [Anaerolineales bacterium]